MLVWNGVDIQRPSPISRWGNKLWQDDFFLEYEIWASISDVPSYTIKLDVNERINMVYRENSWDYQTILVDDRKVTFSLPFERSYRSQNAMTVLGYIARIICLVGSRVTEISILKTRVYCILLMIRDISTKLCARRSLPKSNIHIHLPRTEISTGTNPLQYHIQVF